MAFDPLPVAAATATPTHAELATIRVAHVERINAAMERRMGRRPEAGMPYTLVAVGCFVAFHGFDAEPCTGERWFHMTFDDYRALVMPEMIEGGRQTIYEGRRPILPAAANEAVSCLSIAYQSSSVRNAMAKAAAMSEAFDVMCDHAFDPDPTAYDAAKARLAFALSGAAA